MENVQLRIDASALAEGCPTPQALVGAARELCRRALPPGGLAEGALSGLVVLVTAEPQVFELQILHLSSTTYTASTRTLRFALRNGACTLLAGP